MQDIFDKEYYENGLINGKSCYLNYRWLPELTLGMAYNIIKHLGIKDGETVLDFGCAKGYLVKALRIFGVDAYGCDISRYAIDNVDADVRNFCRFIDDPEKGTFPFSQHFDWVISKDVLEHVNEDCLDKFLEEAYKKADNMFHVVPLGDESGNFIIPEYEQDKTHLLRKNKDWWLKKFFTKGWGEISFSYNVKGVKDNWTSKYKDGNGFIIVKKAV